MLGHVQQRIHQSSVGGNISCGEVATIGSDQGVPTKRRDQFVNGMFVNGIARLQPDQ